MNVQHIINALVDEHCNAEAERRAPHVITVSRSEAIELGRIFQPRIVLTDEEAVQVVQLGVFMGDIRLQVING